MTRRTLGPAREAARFRVRLMAFALGFDDPDPDDGFDRGMKPSTAERIEAALARARGVAQRAGCTAIVTRTASPFGRPPYVSAITPCRRFIAIELGGTLPRCPSCQVCAAARRPEKAVR